MNIHAAIPDLDTALALRPRLEALSWQLIPRVLEKVFDALAPPGLHLRLTRLDLDLGVVRMDELEDDALAALESTLSEALSLAILSARLTPAEDSRLIAAPAMRLEQFETYLVTGLSPLGSRGDPFEPLSRLLELADTQPAALFAMLRRRVRDRHVPERLVLQAGEQGLRALLDLLAPADAATILSMLADAVEAYRAEPQPHPVGLTDIAFNRLLWVTTLEFLLRDAGSQFNRRRFLAFLLEREATRTGMDYLALLRLLNDAVGRARAKGAVRSSLPVVLSDLLAEFAAGSAVDPSGSPVPATADAAMANTEALTRALEAASSEDAVVLLRHAAADPALILSVVAATDEAGRFRLLAILDPVNADAIAADLRTFAGLHAAAPLVARDGAEFGQIAWKLAVSYLASRRGEPFNRHAFWRHVVNETTRLGEVPARDLATALLHGIRVMEQAGASLDSLYGLLGAVAREQLDGANPEPTQSGRQRMAEHFLRTGQPQAAGRSLPGLADSDPVWLAGLIRRLSREAAATASPVLDRLLDWLLPAELLTCLAPGRMTQAMLWADGLAGDRLKAWRPVFAALLRDEMPAFVAVPGGPGARLDRLASITYWLDHGSVPWWSPGGSDPEAPANGVPGATGRDGSGSNGGSAPVASGEGLPADLHHLTLAELTWLFLAANPEHTLARLWRAVMASGPDQRMLLLERLAPWATNATGPLAPVLAEMDEDQRLQIMIRAAAAALEGAELDLSTLIRPATSVPTLDTGVLALRVSSVNAGSLPASVPDNAPGGSSPSGPAVDPARLYAWLDGTPVNARETAALVRYFVRLADTDDPALTDYLQANRSRPSGRAHWARILPQEALGRLVHVLVPADARALLDATLVLASAWRQIAPYGARRPEPGQIWAHLLDLIAAPGPIDLAVAMESLARNLTTGDAGQTAKLRTRTERLARDGGYVSVTAALRRGPKPVRPEPTPGATRGAGSGASGTGRRQPNRPRPEDRMAAAPEPGHAIFIANAGLVLLNPYLPTLFERLGLLTPTESGVPRIQGLEAASRAVHLLQYMVNERLTAPEPALVLNKLLCGLRTGQPVARSVEPAQADLDLCDGLLQAVIGNWPILRNTSPGGLRETFLQRDGRLTHTGGRWNLQVQRKTLDVLTDQVPWSFSLVYHRWMIDPIHVTW